MGQLFSAMLSIVLVWMILLVIFLGLGLLVRKIFTLPPLDFEGVFESLWIGWITMLFLIQLWHLFIPVNISLILIMGAIS